VIATTDAVTATALIATIAAVDTTEAVKIFNDAGVTAITAIEISVPIHQNMSPASMPVSSPKDIHPQSPPSQSFISDNETVGIYAISGVGLFALANFAAVRFRRKAQNCDVKDEKPCDKGVITDSV